MADTDNPCNVESRRSTEGPCNIESPCNKVCVVDPASSLCIGCGRTLAEIAGWIGFTPDERRRIMAELPKRLATPPRKRRAEAS
jgi:predicted Fe-S protein YdhL (DUF1289 family)